VIIVVVTQFWTPRLGTMYTSFEQSVGVSLIFARRLIKAHKEIFCFFETLFELFSALFILPLYYQNHQVLCRTGAASRRNNMIPTLNLKCKLIWQIWGDKKFLSSIGRKWNGSRHLVFWSLGTLTGLRDRVRGLVA